MQGDDDGEAANDDSQEEVKHIFIEIGPRTDNSFNHFPPVIDTTFSYGKL